MHYPAMYHAFREMEDLLDRYAQATGREHCGDERESSAADWMPAVDIQQSAHHYRLRMELPGVHKDDVHMSYRDGKLSIEGSKQAELKTGHDTWRQQSECLYGRFYRSFLLSGVEHPEHIRAWFNNGLLLVQVPRRSTSASSALSIEIESWQHPEHPWTRK